MQVNNQAFVALPCFFQWIVGSVGASDIKTMHSKTYVRIGAKIDWKSIQETPWKINKKEGIYIVKTRTE
jgi:hypothetical protein